MAGDRDEVRKGPGLPAELTDYEQLIDDYKPDLVYFDDSALPLWPVSDAGLQIAAHYYNASIRRHHGSLEAVMFGKILDAQQRRCMVWDIERGQANEIQPLPWQTDTCIGQWHYDRPLYERNGYKTPETVVRTLVDVVSKNGNLLLNIPLRGDGTRDEKELKILDGIEAAGARLVQIYTGLIYEGPGLARRILDAMPAA